MNPEYNRAMAELVDQLGDNKSIDNLTTARRYQIFNDVNSVARDFIDCALAMLDRKTEGRDLSYPRNTEPGTECPYCGESKYDNLTWDDFDYLNCQTCGTIYEPGDVVGGL
jgi:DNA-directed RNA polymerase subunit RPC12/RpoP